MAGAPNKSGFIYFNVDTDIFSNDKIKQLRASHPGIGIETLLYIWTRIYKTEGYFVHWNKKQHKNAALDLNIDRGRLTEIILTCLEEQIFDRAVFEKYQVLTSDNIQEFTILASKHRDAARIVKDWAVFDPAAVQPKKTRKDLRPSPIHAFYLVFPDINLIFDNDELIPHWKRLGALEQVVCDQIIPVLPDQEDPEPPAPPVSGLNGHDAPGVYGTKLPPPVSMDWEAEKRILFDDLDWKTRFSQNHRIGTWGPDRTFVANLEELEKWLRKFYEWCENSGKEKPAAGLKIHFASWYEKRKDMVAEMEIKSVKKASIDLPPGKADYENQKWK